MRGAERSYPLPFVSAYGSSAPWQPPPPVVTPYTGEQNAEKGGHTKLVRKQLKQLAKLDAPLHAAWERSLEAVRRRSRFQMAPTLPYDSHPLALHREGVVGGERARDPRMAEDCTAVAEPRHVHLVSSEEEHKRRTAAATPRKRNLALHATPMGDNTRNVVGIVRNLHISAALSIAAALA